MSPPLELMHDRHGASYKWWATCTVMLGTLSMVLSTTIVNVALADIMAEFGLAHDQVQWLSTGYLAAMTAAMLVNAWCVKALGQRGTYLMALSLFSVASVVGGLSPNTEVLVASRVVQGAMGGLVQPLAMIMIYQVFPADQRGRGIGIYGFGVILGPAIGPALGGVLVDLFSWRAVFFVALPFCVGAMLMALRFMPERDRAEPRPRFDFFGLTLLCGSLMTLLWALSSAERLGAGSFPVVLGLAAGFALAIFFVLHQWRGRQPLLEIDVFRSRGFAAGCAVAFCLGAGLFGSTYLLPLFVQEIQGFSASKAGLMLMPAGLAMAAIFPFSGHLSDRIPAQRVVVTGLLLFAASCVLLAQTDSQSGFWTLAGWAVLGRVGLGLILPPVTRSSLGALPSALTTQGTGAINFSRQLGGVFGVNIMAVVLESRASQHIDALVSKGRAVATARHAAYTFAYHDAYWLLAVVFALTVLPTLLMGRYAANPAQVDSTVS